MEPAKTYDGNSSIRHLNLKPHENLGKTFENLDVDVREAGLDVLVVMKKGFCTATFESNMQKLRLFENLDLFVPTDSIVFCSGGSHASTFVVVQVKDWQNINEILTEEVESSKNYNQF